MFHWRVLLYCGKSVDLPQYKGTILFASCCWTLDFSTYGAFFHHIGVLFHARAVVDHCAREGVGATGEEVHPRPDACAGTSRIPGTLRIKDVWKPSPSSSFGSNNRGKKASVKWGCHVKSAA